jgi:hypothetical protein
VEEVEKGDGGTPIKEGWINDSYTAEKFVWWYVNTNRTWFVGPGGKKRVFDKLVCSGYLGSAKDRGKGLWHDIGYVASYVQLWAATIFWISTLLVCNPLLFCSRHFGGKLGRATKRADSPREGVGDKQHGLTRRDQRVS